MFLFVDDCGTGYYKKPGETGCSECERDTYQDQTSQSSCKRCPDNKVTLLTGAKSVDRCVCKYFTSRTRSFTKFVDILVCAFDCNYFTLRAYSFKEIVEIHFLFLYKM